MLDLNKIYHFDCFEFLSHIDDQAVDLAVIDPPYNLHKAEWDTFYSESEYFDFTYRWLNSLIPKIKSDGCLYLFNTPYNSAHILIYLINYGLKFKNWITWDKRDGLAVSKRHFNNVQETVLFFSKNEDYVFNYNEIRLPYDSKKRIEHAKIKGILKNGKRWFPNPKGKLCGDIWHITSERHKNKINGRTPKMPHLTPKPLELVERIIKASSVTGDIILDCFVGYGTTAMAAKKLGRNFICCDSNKQYVDLARQNLNKIIRNENE